MEGKRFLPRPGIKRKKNHSLVCQRQWDVVVALKASSLQIDSTPELLRYSRIFFANRVSSRAVTTVTPRVISNRFAARARIVGSPGASSRSKKSKRPQRIRKPRQLSSWFHLLSLRTSVLPSRLYNSTLYFQLQVKKKSVNFVYSPKYRSSN